MLKGDLASTPLAPLLVQLAEDLSTGCLHISDAEGDEALVYFKNGLVYAVSVPGHRPQLGAKLISSGALAPEALADALEAQRTELQGWRLGELLVHLAYVDQPVVEAFVKEQVHNALWDLIKWVDGPWKFRKAEKTREDVAPPMAVADLLADLRARGYEWQAISTVVHGPTAVPVLSARGGGQTETTLDADAWSVLCKIDGQRTVAELARDCGYTLFEAGQVIVALVNSGLVDIEEELEATPDSVDADELYGATSVSSALAAEAEQAHADAESIEGDDSFAALARVVTEVAATVREEEPTQAAHVVEMSQQARFNAGNDESFAASIARVSEALADVLGPAPETHDPFEVPHELRARSKKTAQPVSEEEARRTRARQAAAAELAAAHALAEALRASQREQAAPPPADPQPDNANVVDLAAVRREAEASRIEEERLEAERLAVEEAARLEAERLAAEEAARLEAERLAAEEAARLEAARLAAERLEAERLAAEEAARLEAERLAAEEAARLEAERLAAWAREAQAAEFASNREAAASALLTQLSAEPIADVPAQEPDEPQPVVEEEPPPVREPAAVGGRSSAANEMADTAALLRELSSLGLDDEPSQPPAPRSAPVTRPARPAPADKKKKRGFFGL